MEWSKGIKATLATFAIVATVGIVLYGAFINAHWIVYVVGIVVGALTLVLTGLLWLAFYDAFE